MKKVIKYISFIMLFSLMLLLYSCTNGGITRTSGLFTYKINLDTREIMIMGLSKKGQQEETIVIPSILNGKRVMSIGCRYDMGAEYAEFKSEKLKTIYFPSGFSNSDIDDFYDKLPNVEKIFWGDVNSNKLFRGPYEKSLTYVSKQNYYLDKTRREDNKVTFIEMANVNYYINDGTENTYFVDYVSGAIVNVEPPIPYREGYKFKGWYKEVECINKWDFEKDEVPQIEYDSEGKEIFKEVKIYAGWELE